MYPVQSYLGKQFYKGYGDGKSGLSCDDPRQHKGVKAACNAPGYSFKQRLVMTIFCHASWLFSWIVEMLLRWALLLCQAISFSRLILYGCVPSFCEYWRIVRLSSTTPPSSSCFSPFTLPILGSSTK